VHCLLLSFSIGRAAQLVIEREKAAGEVRAFAGQLVPSSPVLQCSRSNRSAVCQGLPNSGAIGDRVV
jgi:hypothetical protein